MATPLKRPNPSSASLPPRKAPRASPPPSSPAAAGASASPTPSSSLSPSTSSASSSPSPSDQSQSADTPPPEPASLQSRLAAFLPRLAAANEALDAERETGRLGERQIEVVSVGSEGEEDGEGEGEGQVVEMNLGLGVLEERGVEREHEDDGGGGEEAGEDDVMGTLMGKVKRKRRRAGIEEFEA